MNKTFKNITINALFATMLFANVACEPDLEDLSVQTSEEESTDINDVDVSGVVDAEPFDAIGLEPGTGTTTDTDTVTEPQIINQVAEIVDTLSDDTGELRYTLDSGLTTGKVTVKVNYSILEKESFYVRLFDSTNKTDNVVADLKMDTGVLGLRDNGTVAASISGNFTQGEFIDVSIEWNNSSTTSAGTYSFIVEGTTYGPYTSENEVPGTEVTSIAFVLSSNAKVSDDKVLIDDFYLFSDISGTTEVFSDDFQDYAVDDSLDTDNTDSPYNSGTSEAIVILE